MGLAAALFGYAALIVFALNLAFASDDADAVCVSIMLLIFWLLSNALVHTGPRPDSMGGFPLIDLVGGLAAWLAWRTKPARWKWWLVRAFGLALVVHVVFWTYYWAIPTWFPDLSARMGEDMSPDGRKFVRNLYVLGWNITGALTLICAVVPGGSNGLVVSRNWLSRHLGRRGALGTHP